MMFQNQINKQIQRVKDSPYAALPGEQVYSRLENALQNIAGTVAKSTLNREIAKEASAGNPFALSLPELITDDERQQAVDTIEKKLAGGEYSFPKPLTEILDTRLSFAADAFLEMLERIAENREEICAVLTDGKLYRRIEDVRLFTGDTHNHGRSVAVLYTDAGKMVYKPRDMRGDAHIHAIARKFFPEFAGIKG